MNNKYIINSVLKIPISLIEGIPIVGPVIGYVVEDYANRQLSRLEETRVGDAAKYCIDKIQRKQMLGLKLRRDDRFFANNENYRSDAAEVFEGVLTKCKIEHEQRKSNFISNIFVNAAFEEVSIGQANYILKLAAAMTFRQFCLLKLIFENSDNKYMLQSKEVDKTYSSEEASLMQEIYDLTQMGLVLKLMPEENKNGITYDELERIKENTFNAMFGLGDIVPGKMVVSPLGEAAYRLLDLEEIDYVEIERFVLLLQNK
ncbi:hypothetical protein [Paenibacillus massiliensis]|uniref:hypothetical protein n=1 Tax=Paenibacillus massiliensis TaxID=225917 RepID=UPI0003FCF320|nr:hypothetical protein [Paenibacillus massiliensis]